MLGPYRSAYKLRIENKMASFTVYDDLCFTLCLLGLPSLVLYSLKIIILQNSRRILGCKHIMSYSCRPQCSRISCLWMGPDHDESVAFMGACEVVIWCTRQWRNHP